MNTTPQSSGLLKLVNWAATVVLLASGCRSGSLDDEEVARSEGWSEASHSNDASPDYELLFSDDVNEIEIEIAPETQEEMEADLRIALTADEAPAWFDVTVRHDGRTWEHVGMRFRANGTIEDIQKEGSRKYPFKLTFDKFEDSYPDTKNQRFYGFKKLSFSTSVKDDTMVREVLASETLRAGGVPTARASFARVVVDGGDVETYWGLYTLLEDPDDPAMQKSQLGGKDGNLYEPSGEGADFSAFVKLSFEKKNNDDAPDYSDVEATIDALHATATDAPAWRAELESVFDVDGFLRFLALNTAMGNKDAYGCESGNYYLYGSPEEEGRLTWVPTDLDRAFSDELGPCADDSLGDEDFLFEGDFSSWPLLSILLADSTYRVRYVSLLTSSLEGAMDLATIESRAMELHDLIEPHVVGEEGEVAGYSNVSSEQKFLDSLTGTGEFLEILKARRALLETALGR